MAEEELWPKWGSVSFEFVRRQLQRACKPGGDISEKVHKASSWKGEDELGGSENRDVQIVC